MNLDHLPPHLKSCFGIIERAKQRYLNNRTTDQRKEFLYILGNTAVLFLSEERDKSLGLLNLFHQWMLLASDDMLKKENE